MKAIHIERVVESFHHHLEVVEQIPTVLLPKNVILLLGSVMVSLFLNFEL